MYNANAAFICCSYIVLILSVVKYQNVIQVPIFGMRRFLSHTQNYCSFNNEEHTWYFDGNKNHLGAAANPNIDLSSLFFFKLNMSFKYIIVSKQIPEHIFLFHSGSIFKLFHSYLSQYPTKMSYKTYLIERYIKQ